MKPRNPASHPPPVLTAAQGLGAYTALCLTLASLWSALRWSSPLWLGLLFVLLSPWILRQKLNWRRPRWPASRPRLAQLALGLALCVPVLVYFYFTAGEEFPFAGDHDHHWLMEQSLRGEFGWWLLLPLAAYAATLWLARRTRWAWPLWLGGALLVSASFEPREYVLRYPAAFYLFAAPFNVVAELVRHFAPDALADPLFANRLANVVALPVYMFVLRPVLVRRWPDLRLALLTLFFVWQKDWIYYFASTNLEPWSLIFVFLALELAVSAEDADVEFAPALAGIGCMFKEQAVFALALTAAHLVWRKRREWGIGRGVLTGGAFFLPFFAYYSARSAAGVFRKVEAGNWSNLWQEARWEQFGVHLHANLELGGEIALGLAAAGVLCAFVKLKPSRRALLALAVLLAAGAEVLYLVDKLSSSYIGYPRFHLLSWPLPAIAALLLLEEHPGWRRGLALVYAVIGLSQLAATYDFYQQARRPDFERNFIEQYYAPVYFPLRELLRALPYSPVPRQLVLNNPVDFGSFPYSIGKVEHRLFQDFSEAALTKSLVCECTGATQVILLIDVYRPPGPAIVDSPSILGPGDLGRCAEKLRHSCKQVRTIEAPGGQTIGAIAFTP